MREVTPREGAGYRCGKSLLWWISSTKWWDVWLTWAGNFGLALCPEALSGRLERFDVGEQFAQDGVMGKLAFKGESFVEGLAVRLRGPAQGGGSGGVVVVRAEALTYFRGNGKGNGNGECNHNRNRNRTFLAALGMIREAATATATATARATAGSSLRSE